MVHYNCCFYVYVPIMYKGMENTYFTHSKINEKHWYIIFQFLFYVAMLDLTQLLGGIKPIKVVLLFMLVWSQNARVARVRLFVRNYCSNGTQVTNLVPPQTPINCILLVPIDI